MLKILSAAALAALSVPNGASAQPGQAAEQTSDRLSIAAGERLTVRVTEEGQYTLVSRETGVIQADVSSPPPSTVRFTLGSLGGQVMLLVENGYSRPFEYRARMFRGRRSAPTSTCTVLAGIAGYELWPHPIDRIELTEPRLGREGERGMRCR